MCHSSLPRIDSKHFSKSCLHMALLQVLDRNRVFRQISRMQHKEDGITLHSGFPACRDFVHYWNVSARRLGYTPLQAPLHYTILHYKHHWNATATPPLHPAIHSSNRLHFTAGHIPGSTTGADAQSRLRPKLSRIGVLQFWEFYLI